MTDLLAPELKSMLTALAVFRRDGYVVIENAISRTFIATVRQAFEDAMEAKVARFALAPVEQHDLLAANDGVLRDFQPAGANHDLNRWNMHLPSRAEFLNEQLIANPAAMPVINALLGPDAIAFLIASDTPYPGAGFQNIHQDFPRFGLTVNIPLVDFTEENAPLEVWPGSHVRGTEFHEGKVELSAAELKALVGRVKGTRLLLKAGSILIRDQRTVHRGTANTGSAARPCLSIWYKNLEKFGLGRLTIPVPHRAVADRMAARALKMRQRGRGGSARIANTKVVNLGNFFGRVVEETSGSDRDARRVISRPLWAAFSPPLRSLLRYASVEGRPSGPRSLLGSALLLVAGSLFSCAAWVHRRVTRTH